MKVSEEDIVMNLVVNGGDGKSKAIEAIRAARNRDFDLAQQKLAESEEALLKAHHFQTELLQEDLRSDEPVRVSLIMVHGQDHLMNAMTVRELAAELVETYKMLYKDGRITE